jgi:[ribosomal protein S18]-alanine N-acetyltransferase
MTGSAPAGGSLRRPLLECRRLSAEWTDALLGMLRALERSDPGGAFRPHPFSRETIEAILRTADRDAYYVLVSGSDVLGYGMLRGWDEGFAIPSLGIAVHPQARRAGLARMLMVFLHGVARWHGASKVRLRVREDNWQARRLYESMGYRFTVPQEGAYLVGFLDLPQTGDLRATAPPHDHT